MNKLLLIALLVAPDLWAANDVEDTFSPLEGIETKLHNAPSAAERSTIFANSHKVTQDVANALAQGYVNGKWGVTPFSTWRKWCDKDYSVFRSTHCSVLERLMPAALYEASLARLRQFGGRRMLSLVQWAEDEKIREKFVIAQEGPVAGIDRGKHFAFVNADVIPSDQWLLVFVHEAVHYIDPILRKSIPEYKAFIESWEKGETLGIRAIHQGLMSGLHRGLLAEWRAWLVTVLFYREGVDRGFWSKADWMESLLSQVDVGTQDLRIRLFQHLRKSFPDPTEAPFNLPNVAQALKDVHADLDRGKGLEVGKLEALLPR